MIMNCFAMKNLIPFLSAVLFLGLMAVSCRTTSMISLQPELEQQWVGRSCADVIDAMGQPEREVADLQDGKILVYEAGATRFYMNGDSFCYAVRTNKQRKETKLDMPKSWALGGAIAGGVLATSSLVQLILMIVQSGVRNSSK